MPHSLSRIPGQNQKSEVTFSYDIIGDIAVLRLLSEDQGIQAATEEVMRILRMQRERLTGSPRAGHHRAEQTQTGKAGNPKSEIRNPKQFRTNGNDQNGKTGREQFRRPLRTSWPFAVQKARE